MTDKLKTAKAQTFDRGAFAVYGERITQRISTQEWRGILLAGKDNLVYAGDVRRLVAKKIGYGVVEVSMKPKETP